MPEEILSREEFLSYLPLASNVLVKRVRGKDIVKIKLRTKKRLYTYKTNPNEANEIIKNLNVPYDEI